MNFLINIGMYCTSGIPLTATGTTPERLNSQSTLIVFDLIIFVGLTLIISAEIHGGCVSPYAADLKFNYLCVTIKLYCTVIS